MVCPPKISVGLPVYNGELYLEDAIRVTLDQTYRDFELIISDNASTDRTEEICRDFAAVDSRIKYLRNNENIGAANNYNILFHNAAGEFFRWFNADDLCSPMLHERCLQTLEANSDAVMCYGKTDIINNNGNLIEHYDDNLNLQQESAAERFLYYLKKPGLTNAIYGLMRRDLLGRTMLMGRGKFHSADLNLVAELTLYGKIIEIPETLFYRRMHEEASSWDRNDDSVQQEFWTGGSSKFKMPTLRKYHAYWRAVQKSPCSRNEKKQMEKFLMKKARWSRGQISKELLQMIVGTFR